MLRIENTHVASSFYGTEIELHMRSPEIVQTEFQDGNKWCKVEHVKQSRFNTRGYISQKLSITGNRVDRLLTARFFRNLAKLGPVGFRLLCFPQ